MSTQVAAKVKASSQPTPSSAPVNANLLQRKCDCGGTPGPDGECTECRQKRVALQRRSANGSTNTTVLPIVHEVLNSSGQPMDAATRISMESRFGHHFGALQEIRALIEGGQTVTSEEAEAVGRTAGERLWSLAQQARDLGERIVRPHAQDVDAVITVSQDPGIAPGGPVRLERYAVGVHELSNGALRPIPAADRGGAGPAIIETQAPVEEIAAETERATTDRDAIPRPTTGEDITFRFATGAEANRARGFATTARGRP